MTTAGRYTEEEWRSADLDMAKQSKGVAEVGDEDLRCVNFEDFIGRGLCLRSSFMLIFQKCRMMDNGGGVDFNVP